MSATNRKVDPFTETTHGGAKAVRLTPKQQLERSVMSCLLWENEFYEEGITIAERIKKLVAECAPHEVADIAVIAKQHMKLRHAPLFLTRELMRSKTGRTFLEMVIPEVIVRPDDITELLAMYLADNKTEKRGPSKLPNQLKRHLGFSFRKFDEYQLAKWRGEGKTVSLKDALRMTHPVPLTGEQSLLWKKLLEGKLATPDTWEVAISAAKNKEEKRIAWESLVTGNKLGGLAALRNLRNMREAGVEDSAIRALIKNIKPGRLLPINFITAAKHNPGFETQLEEKFLECFTHKRKLPGKTILIIDTSGSMRTTLSSRSELLRTDVAASLAMIGRELCEEPVIYCTAGNDGTRRHATMQIPARRGFALKDYIGGHEVNSKIGGGGIFLVQCLEFIKQEQKYADRIIVITDEQDCDVSKNPQNADAFGCRNYLINIANAKNGIGYGPKWTHIDGWSDKVLDYISLSEEQ